MPLPLKLNPALDVLPVYQPGRPIEEVARELGLPFGSIDKLASNENPLGPSPMAMEAVREAAGNMHLYPDGNCHYLRGKLARKLVVEPENLIFGNGSNEVLELLGHALLQPGDEIVIAQYCFVVYPIVGRLFGADVVSVPAKDYGHDLLGMLNAVTDRTRIVFVANPNNPTGTLASREDVVALISGLPEHVLLVLDEAYVEYLDDPVEVMGLIRNGDRPNLFVTRTFSKIYGLAGLRIGYGVGHPEFIAALEKVREPFNVNSLAQAGAAAALDDDEHLGRTRAVNAAGLEYFRVALRKLGIKYVPSSGNFILARVGDVGSVFAELQKRGVITRPVAGYGLPEWLRISVGTPAQNERCIAALGEIVRREE
ncbi:MAG: histidinol-phosphate transaminase [Verrucomicrobiia bacterium]|jgi:histidinol-phosphate aminotransferase